MKLSRCEPITTNKRLEGRPTFVLEDAKLPSFSLSEQAFGHILHESALG